MEYFWLNKYFAFAYIHFLESTAWSEMYQLPLSNVALLSNVKLLHMLLYRRQIFSPAREICNHVIKIAACSKICILRPLQTRASLQDLPIHPTSLEHGAARVAGRLIIPRVSTAHFLLRRESPPASLTNRISYTWLHSTKEQKQPQADVALCTAHWVENWVSSNFFK